MPRRDQHLPSHPGGPYYFFPRQTGAAGAPVNVHWDDILGKPSSFTPTVHNINGDRHEGFPLTADKGGTGQTDPGTGSVLYGNGFGGWSLASYADASPRFLRNEGGVVTWAPVPGTLPSPGSDPGRFLKVQGGQWVRSSWGLPIGVPPQKRFLAHDGTPDGQAFWDTPDVASVTWSDITDFTGSSLMDLATRSAGALSSGNLNYARMPSGAGTWNGSPTISGAVQFSSTVTVQETELHLNGVTSGGFRTLAQLQTGGTVRGRIGVDANTRAVLRGSTGVSLGLLNGTEVGRFEATNLRVFGPGSSFGALAVGLRGANRAELHLNSNGDVPADINFGRGSLADGNIRWTISSRHGSDNDRLTIFEGPANTGAGFSARVSFLKGGRVGINRTSADYQLHVTGDVGATGGFFDTSLRQYKRDIVDLWDELNPLEALLALQPVAFTWRESGSRSLGLIAEDTPAVFKSPDWGAIEYNRIVATLVAAVQSLTRRLEEVERGR